MKKVVVFLAACLVSLSLNAQISADAFQRWHQSKFSMFIHFGLYSELGGVWDGKPIKW